MELGRLYHFDLPVLTTTGKTLPTPLEAASIGRVLDISCGVGQWACATAQAYPHMQVLGIDGQAQAIDEACTQAQARGVGNVSFTVMDPLRSLDFPDGSFDLVNIRFAAGFMAPKNWPPLLHACLRILRPAGVIILTDGDMPVTSSAAFEQLSGMIARALYRAKRTFSPNGETLIIAPMLARLLRDTGCVDIQSVACATNFSTGQHSAHELLSRDFAATYRRVLPFLVAMGVTTSEEVERVYQHMLVEMQLETFCAIGFYLTVWGKKTPRNAV
jgi:ubiquinone/menaquinone biosynthesis C-methylase UbiE